jgi:hypothetical protein
MEPRFESVAHNPYMFRFSPEQLQFSKIAREIYSPQGYAVLPSFIDGETINKLVKAFNAARTGGLNRSGLKYNEIKFYFKSLRSLVFDARSKNELKRKLYEYKTYTIGQANQGLYDVSKPVVEDILKVRTAIQLQPESDGVLQFFCLSSGRELSLEADPVSAAIEVLKKKGAWWRFMQYRDGDFFNPHVDAPGEVMAILHLSQPGKDYTGGLYVCERNDPSKSFCVDDNLNKGDLLLVDAHRRPHWVTNIACNKDALGRLTLFAPGMPFYG